MNFALEQIHEYGLDLDAEDKLWCVFDVDTNSAESIEEARRLAKAGVRLGVSNPSFEVWFLLHFKYWTHKIDRYDVMRDLRGHLPDYSKSKDYFDVLSPKTAVALKNARMLNQHHKQCGCKLVSIDSNPSTQVFRIVEYIRSCRP